MKAQYFKKLLLRTAMLTIIFCLIPFSTSCLDFNLFDVQVQQEGNSKQSIETNIPVCGFVGPELKAEILRTQPDHLVRCNDTLFYTFINFSEHFDTALQIRAAKNGINQLNQALYSQTVYTTDIDKAFTKIVFAYEDEPIPPREGYVMNSSVGFTHYPPANPQDTIYSDNGYIYINERYMNETVTETDLSELIGHEVGHTLGLKDSDQKGTMMYFGFYDQGPASNESKRNIRIAYGCYKPRDNIDGKLDEVVSRLDKPFHLLLIEGLKP